MTLATKTENEWKERGTRRSMPCSLLWEDAALLSGHRKCVRIGRKPDTNLTCIGTVPCTPQNKEGGLGQQITIKINPRKFSPKSILGWSMLT